MPALVAGIHVFTASHFSKTWMAGAGHPARSRAGTPTSPAMTGLGQVPRGDVFARIGAVMARLARVLTNLMFVAVFLAFLYKIVMRYAAGDAVAWAEELTVVLFIWIVFLANGLVVDERRQIAFDLVYRNLSAGGQRWMALARSLLIGGIFVCALPAAVDYIMFLWRERTPVMGWRLDYVYSCFALFMLDVIVRAIYRLALLMSARWQQGL
jgi:TRAP-type C4-dicarboxylate transport system permease small subunit